MKKQSFMVIMAVAITIGALCGLQSCTKLGKGLYFTLPMQTGSVNITIPPTSSSTGTVSIGPATNYYNVDSFVRASTANALNSTNISSVKIVSMVIKVNNATSQNNVANLESCTASFSSNTNSTPYQLTIQSIPDTYADSLVLPVDSTELKSYIGNQFNYSIMAKLRRSTTAPLNCTVAYSFKVIVQG